MTNKIINILLVITIVGFTGCGGSSFGGFSEGEIHYKLIYNNPGGTLPMELMPNSMVVKFKDSRTLMEISAPIGNSGIYNIIEPDKDKILTYISFLGIKYYYQGLIGETPPGIDPMEDLVLIKTDKVKEINGLVCNNATAQLPGQDKIYDIWYTSDIDLKDANASTPYRDIDGVLMNFFYKMGDMIVEFEVTGAYERQVPEKDFVKSDKYLRISRDDMDNIISKMMSLWP